MIKAITKGVEINVECSYLQSHSNPKERNYFFMYEITVINQNDYPVQLKRRQWYIFDSIGDHREVEGEGVVGETPIIQPGEKFIYNSGCNLTTDIGKMNGYYTMRNLNESTDFTVNIPEFHLISPGKLN